MTPERLSNEQRKRFFKLSEAEESEIILIISESTAALRAELDAARAECERLKIEESQTFFKLKAADELADAVAAMVHRGVLGSRSMPADALLNYRENPRTDRSDALASALARAEAAEEKVKLLAADINEDERNWAAMEAECVTLRDKVAALRRWEDAINTAAKNQVVIYNELQSLRARLSESEARRTTEEENGARMLSEMRQGAEQRLSVLQAELDQRIAYGEAGWSLNEAREERDHFSQRLSEAVALLGELEWKGNSVTMATMKGLQDWPCCPSCQMPFTPQAKVHATNCRLAAFLRGEPAQAPETHGSPGEAVSAAATAARLGEPPFTPAQEQPMSEPTKTLQKASHELWNRYMKPPAGDLNVTAIGHGAGDTIILYVKKSGKAYPDMHEGFRIVVKASGPIEPATGGEKAEDVASAPGVDAKAAAPSPLPVTPMEALRALVDSAPYSKTWEVAWEAGRKITESAPPTLDPDRGKVLADLMMAWHGTSAIGLILTPWSLKGADKERFNAAVDAAIAAEKAKVGR